MNPEDKRKMLLDTLRGLMRRGAEVNIKKIVEKTRAEDLSEALLHLPRLDRRSLVDFIYKIDLDKCALALSELPREVGVQLIQILGTPSIKNLLEVLEPDDAAEFMDAFPDELKDELLEKMQSKDADDVQELLSFPSETAGRIMTPNVFALLEDLTVEEAISKVQKASEEFEMVFYLYVVDTRNHLVGIVSLRQLLQNAPSKSLKEIMSTDLISVRTHTDQEEVARQVSDYNLLAIPVLDDDNKLAGIVTVDDVIDVIRSEATEDLFALAGVDAQDRALGRARNSFRRRLPWLLGSLFTMVLICYFIIGPFEENFKTAPLIAVLLPLVAAMGGHSATQTMTVVVRGFAMGEVTEETRKRALIKEMMVGLLNGVAVALIAGLVIAFLFRYDATDANPWGLFPDSSGAASTVQVEKVDGPEISDLRGLYLGGVVSASLFILMIFSATIGASVPVILRLLHFDPAIASGIFVITLTDMIGMFTYLGLAVWLG